MAQRGPRRGQVQQRSPFPPQQDRCSALTSHAGRDFVVRHAVTFGRALALASSLFAMGLAVYAVRHRAPHAQPILPASWPLTLCAHKHTAVERDAFIPVITTTVVIFFITIKDVAEEYGERLVHGSTAV
jgi:hypothetical protein